MSARQRGWPGSILYVRSHPPAYSEFDREHWLEGTPDLRRAKVVARFDDGQGGFRIEVLDLGAGPAGP